MSAARLESAIYRGEVYHQRVVPKQHEFTYNIFLFWLKLDEVDQVATQVAGFKSAGFGPAVFKRGDYLGDPSKSLSAEVLKRCHELGAEDLQGDVFMLGQVRVFGLYFSPVNFYFVRNQLGHYTHMLAEVSNTPWNKRHHYLVDLDQQAPTEKAFHVSPFNPMDMVYRWSVQQPNEHMKLALSCYQEQRHFTAAINMTKMSLNSKSMTNVMLSIPSMTIKTVAGIYWQALKLFIKRVPFYSYPSNNKEY